MYGLIDFLHSFKITRYGISCYDTFGNDCYFDKHDKFKFYKVCLMLNESSDNIGTKGNL